MKYSQYIDHTLLKPQATMEDIKQICNEAKEHEFYSVCVNPCFVEFAKQELQNSDVKVACVVGFPLGASLTKIKTMEAQMAIQDGADEIDMVINVGKLKEKNYDYILNEINQIASLGKVVKVIIETCLLTDEEIIKMCEIINKSNALFIKTSTGFSNYGATTEHIKLIKKHLAFNKKIKASGGIRDKQTFVDMIECGADRIGTSSGVKLI